MTHWSWEGIRSGEYRVSGWDCFSMRWEEGRWKVWRMSFDFDTIACQINQGGKVVDGDDYDEGAEIE